MVEVNQGNIRNSQGFSPSWSDPNYDSVNVDENNQQIVAQDPTGAGAANQSIFLWNPNAASGGGLFPKRFPSTVSSYQELVSLVQNDMGYQERLAFKRKLWAAGLYEGASPGEVSDGGDGQKVSGYEVGSELTGNWDNAVDDMALQKLYNRYKEDNKNVKQTGAYQDVDNIFSDLLVEQAGTTRSNLISNYDLPGLTLSLQSWAAKNMKRQLTDQEVQKLLQQTFSFDQEPGEVSSTNQWSAQNIMTDPMTKKQIVTGGGPDSSAINFARGLAATYNVAVDTAFTLKPKMVGSTPEFDEAFTEGRAVKLTGDRQRLIKLHEWANTQKEGVFENVRFVYENNSNEPSGLLLSMKDGGQVPPIGISSLSFSQNGTELDKFLDSVKRPGDVYAYSWEGEGPNRRGAYGLSDQIWEYYSNQLGIDSGDTSITSQDRVARAYVSNLWERYGSWKEVALALRLNEDTANRRAFERQSQGEGFVDVVTDPSELNWADQAIAKMGEWKPTLDLQKSEDLYASMYGNNLNYVPLNPFAGVPSPGQAENKLLWLAQKANSAEMDANNILQMVMKNASNNSVRDFRLEGNQ